MRACLSSWAVGLMFVAVAGAGVAQEPAVVAPEPAVIAPAPDVVRPEPVVIVSEPAAIVDLPALRASVVNQLLDRSDPRAALLDHIWKSNGGARIPRDAANRDAQALAWQLAGRIDFNADTGTLSWPVVGFTDRASIRFAPGVVWDLFLPYLTERELEEAELRALQSAFIANAETHPVGVDPLVPPVGLTLPADVLLAITGYGGSRLFVYSPANCFDVAVKCYGIGRLEDARVLLSHALAQRQDPRYYYVRGTIEMLAGYPEDARMSALGFNAHTAPLTVAAGYIYERVNGPPAIQFRHLAAYLAGRI
jgi:hypothetical protein